MFGTLASGCGRLTVSDWVEVDVGCCSRVSSHGSSVVLCATQMISIVGRNLANSILHA